LGIIPGWGGTQRLARVCGPGIAKELIFTRRTVDAHEALRIGPVNGGHRPGGAKARETAPPLPPKSPGALRGTELVAHPGRRRDHGANLEAEAESFGELFSSDDAKEGLAAFVEKREPRFSGR